MRGSELETGRWGQKSECLELDAGESVVKGSGVGD